MSVGKRLLDVTAAMIALTIFTPALIIATSLIRLEDGGQCCFARSELAVMKCSCASMVNSINSGGLSITKVKSWKPLSLRSEIARQQFDF